MTMTRIIGDLISSQFSYLIVGVILGLLCSCITFGCSDEINEHPSPNVVFILADDLGYSDLSCMGSTYYETPNIDRIAQQGAKFTNGYATCQVCSPSRASIMTGRLPVRHGITDWIGASTGEDWRKARRFTRMLPPSYVRELPDEDVTLAEAMKTAGYKTFFAGKWHLGGPGSYPEDHGFDENEGGYERGGPYSGGYFSPFNNPKMDDKPGEEGMSLSMKLAKETSEFITTNKDKPFLAYLSFYAVHAPIQTSKAYWAKYREKATANDIEPEGFDMERRMPIRKYQDNPVYAGLIQNMDDAVGYVLGTLEDLGLEENTIVVFTSDNGGVASGDDFATSNSPLRGGKGYQWEGGLRVPYMIHIPWLQSGGFVSDVPVTGTDFYPTILEACGISLLPDQHIDGRSLIPLFDDRPLSERSLYWHYPHYGNQGGDPSAVVRRGDWKLIHYFENGNDELYNLKEDLSESRNLADERSDLTSSLSEELQNWLRDNQAKLPRTDPYFSQDSAQMKYNYYSNDLKKRLELQRTTMLDKDWEPNPDWWGSTID